MRPTRASLDEATLTLERLAGDARVPPRLRACIPRMVDACRRGMDALGETGQA